MLISVQVFYSIPTIGVGVNFQMNVKVGKKGLRLGRYKIIGFGEIRYHIPSSDVLLKYRQDDLISLDYDSVIYV